MSVSVSKASRNLKVKVGGWLLIAQPHNSPLCICILAGILRSSSMFSLADFIAQPQPQKHTYFTVPGQLAPRQTRL